MVEGDESSCRDALDRLFFACLQYLVLREDASLIVHELVGECGAALSLIVASVDRDPITAQTAAPTIGQPLEGDVQMFAVTRISPGVVHTGQARARHRQKRR